MQDTLRKVLIKLCRYEDKNKYGETATGYFHKFITYANEDGSDPYALCELEDGSMVETNPTNIRFLDREG